MNKSLNFKLITLLISLFFCGNSIAQLPTSDQLVNATIELTDQDVTYDPRYFTIDYPMGDVPSNVGVCTDVVIRAYRKVGTDLQQKVHEDMKANFGLYPKFWGLKYPDKNIDHRRVPNLMTYFERFGTELPKTKIASDYKPGDIVCWDLGAGLKHIGIVIDQKSSDGTPLIVHNIGGGQVVENFLFEATIIGHYRYLL
jgi:uncharacterized protein YijF (DUF1287 family)